MLYGSTDCTNVGIFHYTSCDYPLYFFADPPHMLKLARNALGELKVFVDQEGRNIEWRFITLLHDEQTKLGLKFANSLSTRHVEYKRTKMNVKLASKTLSSSVADALQFLLDSGHPSFHDSEGTIQFIRILDRLFDLLNSRNPFGPGYKTPLRLANMEVWKNTITTSINYLLGLRCVDGSLLVNHRRRTFINGFIVSAKSAERLALDLFEKGYMYFLTYKMSQDHLELLFACIRGKNGFNNNPDARMFKSALRRLLLRNSIVASKNANCAVFEANDFNPIFSLKWSKNRAPLQEEMSET